MALQIVFPLQSGIRKSWLNDFDDLSQARRRQPRYLKSRREWRNSVIDVAVSSDAERDMQSGADYYESKEIGLGLYFRSSILADLTSLEVRNRSRVEIGRA